MLHLLGLTDDYRSDGQVISQVVRHPSRALLRARTLGTAYRMINSAVGPLATRTLRADSRALAGGSGSHDARYVATERALTRIANQRDRLAVRMKAALAHAAAGHQVRPATSRHLVARAHHLLREVDHLR